MATTYTLISSNVLASDQTTITFSSIPQTYTDLSLRVSGRANQNSNFDLLLSFNGTNSGYSYTYISGNGSSASTLRGSSQTNIPMYSLITASGSTANAFANIEIYIPNYTGSSYVKQVGGYGVNEINSASGAIITAISGLNNFTSAITSISLTVGSGGYLTGSSFYLYGIKSS